MNKKIYSEFPSNISTWKKNRNNELKENRKAWIGLMIMVGLVIFTTLICLIS